MARPLASLTSALIVTLPGNDRAEGVSLAAALHRQIAVLQALLGHKSAVETWDTS